MNRREEQELDLGLTYLCLDKAPKQGQITSQKKNTVKKINAKSTSRNQPINPAQAVNRSQNINRSQGTNRSQVIDRNKQIDKSQVIQSKDAKAKKAAARKKQVMFYRKLMLIAAELTVLVILVVVMFRVFGSHAANQNKVSTEAFNQEETLTDNTQGDKNKIDPHPDWQENFLTPNENSRPGDALLQVNNIFVHYTANPGTSAAQNRSYFENLMTTKETSASAHFIIGYEGEIIQCIPLDEIAYAVQTRNEDSISIECCYLAEDGGFTEETYESLIKLLAWLTNTYELDTEDILRHYDCGGKKCPIYYVQNENAWQGLKADVNAAR
ncbi:peptidoglycan recognition protein family protein [Lachnospiraceae bacterium OttesenSCG-928-D06]|nr:peptidoglycan recognition protein family protein [Lachnospiraceae bacterium OttesenSCG-928-D06]